MNYVWLPVHLKTPVIPHASGQLAELIVYINSTRVDLYSHQILLMVAILLYTNFCNNNIGKCRQISAKHYKDAT